MTNQIKIVNEEDVASIIYTVKNTGECVVDINLEDFSPENVEFFAHLFYDITSGKFSDTTLQLIQDGFSESGHPEFYKKFLGIMQEIARIELSSFFPGVSDKTDKQNSRSKSPKRNEDKERNRNEKPCISPTDLLRGG